MSRTMQIKPQADKDSLTMLKKMIRDYPKLKQKMEVYSTYRRSVLEYLKIKGGTPTKEQILALEAFNNIGLPANEEAALKAFLDAREQVFLLESGMGIVPNGRRKEIAKDKIFNRLSSAEITKKYGIGYNTYRRAMTEVSNFLGMYIDEYITWKTKSLYI